MVMIIWVVVAATATCGREVQEETVQLSEVSGSGQAGEVVLESVTGSTEVTIEVNPGPPADDPQPVHVHFGRCGPGPGDPHYILDDVVAGHSTTSVAVRLSELKDGNHAINLHGSYAEVEIYSACGGIPGRQLGLITPSADVLAVLRGLPP